jgi:hypothetical protein
MADLFGRLAKPTNPSGKVHSVCLSTIIDQQSNGSPMSAGSLAITRVTLAKLQLEKFALRRRGHG